MKFLFSFFIAVVFINLASAQVVKPVKIDSLKTIYTTAKGVTVVNFWSTWCKPCVEEIPHFISITDSLKSKGVHLVLVSLDLKKNYTTGALKTFLQKKKWKSDFYFLDELYAADYCPVVDSNWSGVIPATIILNNEKNYSQFYETGLTKTALREAILKAMK